MKNAQQLRDERADKIDALRNIDAAAVKETRALSPDEETQYKNLKNEITALDKEIERAVDREKFAIESAAAGAGASASSSEEKKAVRDYSLHRAIKGQLDGKLDGLEAEMHQEAEREAKENGVEIKNLGIPSMVLNASRRDNSVTMPTQPEDGAVLVRDEDMSFVEMLRSALVLRQLGATYLTGLRGNVPIGSQTQGAVATWKEEVEELDKSNLKFGKTEMKPHRLGTYTKVSKQLLIQSSRSVEALTWRDLMEAIAYKVELAALTGSGLDADNEPLGILNTPGIGSVALGTNGGVPTYEALVALEAAVETQNANTGTLGFLLNPNVKAKLKMSKLDEGSGLRVLSSNTELNGYRYATSTVVPNSLEKGTSGATLSPIIYGNWRDLLIGQWGGLDLLADKYTLATNGQVRLIVDSFWDTMVRRAASFAAIKDAVTTLV